MYRFRCFLGWKTPYLGSCYQINSFLVFSIGWKSVLTSVRFSLNFLLFNWFENTNDDLSILISIPLFQSFNSPKAEFKSLPWLFGRQMNFTCPFTRVCLLNILKHKQIFSSNVFLFKKSLPLPPFCNSVENEY